MRSRAEYNLHCLWGHGGVSVSPPPETPPSGLFHSVSKDTAALKPAIDRLRNWRLLRLIYNRQERTNLLAFPSASRNGLLTASILGPGQICCPARPSCVLGHGNNLK